MEKQIREVIFSNGTATKTVAGFYQWSHGQILRIKGLTLPAAVEVHFALRRSGEAIRRIGITKDGVTEVEIPDTLFRTMITSDYDAYAYIYVSDEEYGTTTHEIVMKIKSRPMPEDEKDTFENILKSVNAIADGKVNIEQGEENNGKYLGIVDGKVVLVDAPEGTSGASSAVQYVEQILTEAQKTQARSNIGAASKAEVSGLSEEMKELTKELKNQDSGQNVELDTTLTVEGKAADAKAVGDGLALKAEQKWFERFLAKMGLTMEDLLEKLPKVNLYGDLTGISADDYVDVTCHYLDEVNAVEFNDYAEIAWQGSSSINFANVEDGVDKAKNYKIKLYTDEARETKSKRVFKDWFATNNFHIKANYGDCTNFMNNMMMHYLTKSYQYLTPLPRDGAMYTVDGFPVLLYINDVFCGIRFWNLKQSDKVYKLNEEEVDESGNVTQEADLCYQIGLNNGSSKGDNSGAFIYGNLNSGSNAGKNFADAHAEIDYYWEDRVWDKTGNHPDVLYNTIQWVSEASDEEFKANLEQYFDKEYLINYFVMMYTCGMGDSVCKNFNMLYFPDIGKWYATFWDMDFAWGTNWGTAVSSTNIDVLSSGYGASRLFTKLWANFADEIKAKYWELRQTVLTVAQVEDSINAVWGNVSSDWIVANKKAKYDGTSYGFKTDGADYVRNWASSRLSYMDTIMAYTEEIPTTAISLSATELTFDSEDSQTLTATVTPSNSTQAVTWKSSDNTVATVVGGIVTPVGQGNCEITATSGECSAVCAVTVNVESDTPSVSYSDGYINDSGELTYLSENYVSNEYTLINSNAVHVIAPTEVVVRIAEYDKNKNFIKRHYSSNPDNVTNYMFVANEETVYIRIGAKCSDPEYVLANTTVVQVQDGGTVQMEVGDIDSTSGDNIVSANKMRSISYVEDNSATINVLNGTGKTAACRIYDTNGTLVGGVALTKVDDKPATNSSAAPASMAKVRFVVADNAISDGAFIYMNGKKYTLTTAT